MELRPGSSAANMRRPRTNPRRDPGRRRRLASGSSVEMPGGRGEPCPRYGRIGVLEDRRGRRAASGHTATLARHGEFPCGESRDSRQQPSLPAESAARSRSVRRIAAELHGPRPVHSYRGIAGRALRRHLRADRPPFRLWIAAAAVHTGSECQDRGAEPILPQVPRSHVQCPARGVSSPGQPMLRMEGSGTRFREQRCRAPPRIAIGTAVFGAAGSAASSDRRDDRRHGADRRRGRTTCRSSRARRGLRSVGP